MRGAARAGLTSAPGTPAVRPGPFEIDGKGAHVTPVGGHGSHLMGDLSEANALIVLGEDVTSVEAGEQVQVLVLDREF